MSERNGDGWSGVSRRGLLAASGAGAVALAGCSASSRPDGSDDGTQGSTETPDEPELPSTSPPEVVQVDERGGSVTLGAEPARHAVHPLDSMGGPVELPEVWAFKADDGPPSVPGPILRTTEGTDIEVTLDNTGSHRPHTLHFHGVRKTWENDGVPTTTGIRVDPGETHTYSIPANVPGTHFYHCHYQTHNHVDMGMYGIFRVDPVDYEPADREYFLTVKEWDSRINRSFAGEDVQYRPRERNPDVFTINGKSLPRTLHPDDGSPIVVSSGDTVRLHFVNAGYMSHPLHTHNHRFRLVEKDGGRIPEAAQYERDITNVSPAERHTVEFEADADPGIYLLHCHKVDHAMNGNSYPGGMVTGIVYESVMESEVFTDLMEYAGYEF